MLFNSIALTLSEMWKKAAMVQGRVGFVLAFLVSLLVGHVQSSGTNLHRRQTGMTGSDVYMRVAAGLTTIPSDIPRTATTVHLGWNNISHLSPALVSHLTACRHLTLTGNQIASIANYTFLGMTQLQELNLDHNRLGENVGTGYGAFSNMWTGLTSLKILNLRDNSLGLSEVRFSYETLPSLQQLDLGRNNFSEGKIFFGSAIRYSLVELRMDGCELDRPKNDLLPTMMQLRILDLSDNRFQNQHYLSFLNEKVPELDLLDLSNNQLTEFPRFNYDFSKVRELDLSSNNFDSVDMMSLKKFPNLKTLKLSKRQSCP